MILLLLKLIGSVFTFIGANLIVSLFDAGDAASIAFDLALAQNIAILIAFGLNVAIMDVKKNNLDIYTLFKLNIFASIFNVAFMIAIYCLFIGYDIRVLVMAFMYSIHINISGFFNADKKYIKASSFSTIASGLVLLSLLSLSVMNLDYTKNYFLNNLIYIGLICGFLYIFPLLKKKQ